MKVTTDIPQSVDRDELEQRVKAMYQQVALQPDQQYHFEMGRSLAERLGYPSSILNQIPAPAIDSFAGVGYYFDLANLQAGESVLDLGSGSGMDVFFAAQLVGKYGNITGIDMTPEQLSKARELKSQEGFDQVSFVESYIEQLPVPENSIDVVISNGVINLSSEKAKVFREAARILKSGGRLAIADIVTSVALPSSISCNATLWAACIGGAMQEQSYLDLITAAGFDVVQVKDNPYQFLSKGALGATKTYGIKSISLLAIKQ